MSEIAIGAGLCTLSIGCGDITDSVGKQGRLEFALVTDYEVVEDELTEAAIVTGHTQRISVDLTPKGEDDIDEPDQIAYRGRPSEGVEVTTLEGTSSDPPDLEIRASEPGKYEIEAIYKGKVIDAIDLGFDKPDALEISLKLRAPYEDDFKAPNATASVVTVREGTQATFLPIPKKGERRLAGDIETEVRATPKERVVPGAGAGFVYEQSVWSAEGNIDFYFVDPGRVTITITDPVSEASGEYEFEVTDVE